MNFYVFKAGILLFHVMFASVLTLRKFLNFMLMRIAEECFNLNSRIIFFHSSHNTLFLWDTTTSHLLGCLADIM